MIQRQLKLRLNTSQETQLNTWLFHLTGVWNWAIRKIEQDANDGISYTRTAFHNLLADHSTKLGIPGHTLQGMLDNAYTAWQRCYKKLTKRPRLKGQRNKLTSIPCWVCAVCGTVHDRDVNAAMNTLAAGVGMILERHRKMAPGIPAF